MTQKERNELIQSYRTAPQLLNEALKSFPHEMWQWKPAPEKWSIHEVIIHIADSEANSYVRCRRLIAEPGSSVYGYDENKWARELNYHDLSTDDALDLFRILRKLNYEAIRFLPDEVWDTASVLHSESGPMTLPQWLKIYEDHIPVHIQQMKRNYDAWVKNDRKGLGM